MLLGPVLKGVCNKGLCSSWDMEKVCKCWVVATQTRLVFSSRNFGKFSSNLTCAYISDGWQQKPPTSMDMFFSFIDFEVYFFTHLIKGDSRDPQQWDPLMGSFPYYSHTTPIRIPKDMGMVWVPLTIKGVPLLGVPENFPYLIQIDSFGIEGNPVLTLLYWNPWFFGKIP